METYFKTHQLAVGYDGRILIDNINIEVEKGKILTLIGPNGAGKSTILKTLTRHLKRLGGAITVEKEEIGKWTPKHLARQVAVVFTGHLRTELMTCEEVVAMGRYPYTDALGRLTEEDRRIVAESLERVHASDIAGRDFSTLSDGQKQRIMLARAICQEPKILVLDEPTAFLDIRYKVELLDILRQMTREKGMTVIMSLHEIDLAAKVSDYLICVKGDRIAAFGTPEEVLKSGTIEALYDMECGAYDLLFGSVEMARPGGEARVFVIGGDGRGVGCYRALQKRGVAFAAGILYRNDAEFRVAQALAAEVISAEPFEPMTEEDYRAAEAAMLRCEAVVDAGTPVGTFNQMNGRLLDAARRRGLPVLSAADVLKGEEQ